MGKHVSHGLIVAALAIGLGAALAAPESEHRFLTGVNIAGAEFNGKKLPGVPNQDYFYPKPDTIEHVAAEGMNVIRVPFRWERIQPTLTGDLDPAEYRRLAETPPAARPAPPGRH